LMYLNYEFVSNGYKTIYLGESLPMEDLKSVKKYFSNLVYVSYFTVKPEKDDIDMYIETIENEVLDDETEFWILGKMTAEIDPAKVSSKIKIFNSIENIISSI
jgi:MerR family transcriptional regulator, light-induced transcriptional regulator